MKKFIIPAFFAVAFTTSCGNEAVEAGDEQEVVQQESNATYGSISDGSSIEWKAWHWGKLDPRFGKMSISEAYVSTKNNSITNGKFTIDISSLTVENFSEADSIKTKKLTGHLKNEDFFLVSTFPTATFEITGIDTTSGDYNTVIRGNLTLKDSTKNISFESNVVVSDDAVSISSETFEIDRINWGLKYKEFDNIIHNNIELSINVNISK